MSVAPPSNYYPPPPPPPSGELENGPAPPDRVAEAAWKAAEALQRRTEGREEIRPSPGAAQAAVRSAVQAQLQPTDKAVRLLGLRRAE
jgi:hypothetical protein